ncbi:hypothetical protein TSUD_282700 [Trifolium subterraneum]|uniref:Uncharacterized protein n=1 Tax=Trifolium subterraneum TaxID=3900 RepID=A0A2Z6PDB3_TRISU|nr:hypothetical protein TSUD_282700 [Trifolium subterraneum]
MQQNVKQPTTQHHHFSREYGSLGNQEIDYSLQELFVKARSVVPEEPKNELHVKNLIQELIKENQRLVKKIEQMDATQTKMLSILVDLKKNELKETLKTTFTCSPIENANIAKKLSFTPSPSSLKRKNTPTKQKNKLEAQLLTPGSSCKSYKSHLTKATLPKYAKCRFPPIKKMYLKPEEAILCLYLFPENVGFHLHSPMVFKVGEHCLELRNDFQCMMPDGWIGDRVTNSRI